MKILIVRHAIALEREEWAKLSKDDRERPLTEEGAKKMKRIAKGIKKILNDEPTVVVSSPLLRAKQTAELLLNEMPTTNYVETETLSPDQEPETFVNFIRSFATPATKVVACVGHEPHLNQLISWLVCKSRKGIGEMKKGGACFIEFEDEVGAGKGKLVWLLTSRQLREISG